LKVNVLGPCVEYSYYTELLIRKQFKFTSELRPLTYWIAPYMDDTRGDLVTLSRSHKNEGKSLVCVSAREISFSFRKLYGKMGL